MFKWEFLSFLVTKMKRPQKVQILHYKRSLQDGQNAIWHRFVFYVSGFALTSHLLNVSSLICGYAYGGETITAVIQVCLVNESGVQQKWSKARRPNDCCICSACICCCCNTDVEPDGHALPQSFALIARTVQIYGFRMCAGPWQKFW